MYTLNIHEYQITAFTCHAIGQKFRVSNGANE